MLSASINSNIQSSPGLKQLLFQWELTVLIILKSKSADHKLYVGPSISISQDSHSSAIPLSHLDIKFMKSNLSQDEGSVIFLMARWHENHFVNK